MNLNTAMQTSEPELQHLLTLYLDPNALPIPPTRNATAVTALQTRPHINPTERARWLERGTDTAYIDPLERDSALLQGLYTHTHSRPGRALVRGNRHPFLLDLELPGSSSVRFLHTPVRTTFDMTTLVSRHEAYAWIETRQNQNGHREANFALLHGLPETCVLLFARWARVVGLPLRGHRVSHSALLLEVHGNRRGRGSVELGRDLLQIRGHFEREFDWGRDLGERVEE